MVKQDAFAVEQFMDKYENSIVANMGETCCSSISFEQLTELVANERLLDKDELQRSLMEKILQSKMEYAWIKGSDELKEAIISVYNSRRGDGDSVEPSELVITNGTIGANFLVFYTLLDPGDHVIAVSPSYQQLSSVPGVFNGDSSNVDLVYLKESNGYLPAIEDIEKLVKPETKLLVINNPNNPTGAVMSNDLLQNIVELCKKYDIYVLCDEAYFPLYHSVDEASKSIIQFGYKKAISSSSVSKAFSMAGLRLGWIASHDEVFINSAFEKRDYNTISMSLVNDILATFLLQNGDTVLKRNYKLCTENLKLLDDFVKSSNGLISLVRPKGGSTAFIKINSPGLKTYDLCCELAEKHKCLVVPGEVFGPYSGHMRIGFGNLPSDLENGLRILRTVLEEKNLWKR